MEYASPGRVYGLHNPADKLLKGMQLICSKLFFRIFARLNIQDSDFVFVRHCNNSFFGNKNTAVSGRYSGCDKLCGRPCIVITTGLQNKQF